MTEATAALSLSPATIAIIAVIALLAAFCFSSIAFGFALVMVPILSLVWDVKPAIVTAVILAVISMPFLLYEARSSVPVGRAAPILVGSLATIPIGILVLDWIDPASLRVMVAVAVIVAAVTLYLSPKAALGRPRLLLSLLVGCISGFLRATTGFPGPPVALYILSYESNIQKFRATLLAAFLPSGLATIAGLALAGLISRDVLIAIAISLPSVAIGLAAGVILRSRVSQRAFRILVILVLVGNSTIALVSATT